MEAGTSGIPRQRLPKNQKTKQWGQNVMDSLDTHLNAEGANGRTSSENKLINYDLYNGVLDLKDFEYVTDPYNNGKEFPASLQHYDIISPKINLLLGEEIKRFNNFRATATNSDAVSEIEKEKAAIIKAELTKVFKQAVEGVPVAKPGEQKQDGAPMLPEELERYLKYEYQDIREKTANDILRYLIIKEKLAFKFNRGFKDALIGGEEVYWIGVSGGQPIVRSCNTTELTFIMDPDEDNVANASAVIEERYVSIGTIIDEFYDELTPTEIDKLEKLESRGASNDRGDVTNYPVSDIHIQGHEAYKARNRGIDTMDGAGNCRIVRYEWASLKKVGFLQIYDASTDSWDEELVDESFTVPETATKDKQKFYNWTDEETDLPMKLKWDWINEYWEGTKISDDIYIGIRAKTNQRRDIDNPAKCKNGYVGYLYNARNSQSISLIDRMKPYQYLYNILMYRTELAFAKTKGKLAVMDLAQIPRSEGWDIDSWMYYMDAMGIMFINSKEEGNQGQPNTFNQFGSVDLSMGNYIQQHIGMLDQVKAELEELAGVSRQRMGQISSSELVGNTERAVTQSSHITEYWFTNHDELKRDVYEALIDTAKIAWKNSKKKIQYILGDMSRIFIDLEDNIFGDTEYGVFMTNSSKDIKATEALRGAAQQSLASGNLKISEYAQIMKTDSLAEITRDLERSSDKQQEQQMQQAQADREAAIEAQKIAQQTEIEKQNREDKRNQNDNATKIEVARIQAQTKLLDSDLNNNGVKDSIDREKFIAENNFKTQKLASDREAKNRELDIKEKDLEIKKQNNNKQKN